MKTKTQQHTPTPDVLDVLEYASCQSCGSKMIAYKVRANIVRAVNSHEALLELVKRARTRIPGQAWCNLADQVIAQAEGK